MRQKMIVIELPDGDLAIKALTVGSQLPAGRIALLGSVTIGHKMIRRFDAQEAFKIATGDSDFRREIRFAVSRARHR